MRNRGAFIASLLGIVLAAGLCYRFASYASRGGSAAPRYSVRRHDPYGTAALHAFLIKIGSRVSLMEHGRLPRVRGSTLLQIRNSFFSAPAPAHSDTGRPAENLTWRRRQIRHFLARGNTIIACARRLPLALTGYGAALRTTLPPGGAEPIWHVQQNARNPRRLQSLLKLGTWRSVAAVRQHRWLHGRRRLQMWAPSIIKFRGGRAASPKTTPKTAARRPDAAAWHVLARTPQGPVAAERRVGKGRLVLIGAPDIALNALLPKGGNLSFLLSLIGRRPVLFDEYIHGFVRRYTIIRLLSSAGFIPALLQIALVLLLYGWSTYQITPPAAPKALRPREAAERIIALARLYESSLPPGAVAARTQEQLLSRLSAALRCSKNAVATAMKGLPANVQFDANHLLTDTNSLIHATGRACEHCGITLPNKAPAAREAVAASAPGTAGAASPPGPMPAATCPACGRQLAAAGPPASESPSIRKRALLARLTHILSESIPITQEIERARRRGR